MIININILKIINIHVIRIVIVMDKEYAMKYLTHIVVQVQKVSVVKIYFEVNMFDEKCLVLYKSKNLKFILLFYFLNKFLNYKLLNLIKYLNFFIFR